MAGIVVHGMTLSAATRRVIATLHEKELSFELVKVDLRKGEHKSPEYLKLNPLGVIPTVDVGKLRLIESRAIARCLATKYADKGTVLLGKTPEERAVVEQWLEVEVNNYQPAAQGVLRELLFKKVFFGLEPDQETLEKSRKALGKILDVYEARLSEVPYLAGEGYSLADLSHLPYGEYLVEVGEGDFFFSRPHVKDWWERISARPAWKKTAVGSWLKPLD